MSEPNIPLRQWQIRRIPARKNDLIAIIVDADWIIERRHLIYCVLVRNPDELPSDLTLLTVPITEPIKGVAAVTDLRAYGKDYFAEWLGDVDDDVAEQIRATIRARFDL
ncbi:hypothetical protein ACIBG8_54325 [Nonomuraea sp. NPDC050556]|uniref:hypothetical protein n=1 Tax=Nonomuraea sp. NPDC050556 TaxID=3364369 RepID=UPI003797687A